MVLADVQTVTGEKTFLNLKLGLRNVANTFTSYFTNANTAIRTYTLQNKNGTLADLVDVAAKQNLISGTVNRILKNVGTNLFGNSRLWDTGTFFGIGTVNSPLKDISLGNQGNKEIGIEESNSTTIGRSLTISAGKTINYVLSADFLQLIGSVVVQGLSSSGNNVYAVIGQDIYKQTDSVGNFEALGQLALNYRDLCASPNGDVYACVGSTGGGGIYKQTNGIGDFISLSQTTRTWSAMCASPNGDIYACVGGYNGVAGDIYKQAGGIGDFVALEQIIRGWGAMCSDTSGNIYAAVGGLGSGDIYKQTNGIGDFMPLGFTVRNYRGMAFSPNGNFYVSQYAYAISVRFNNNGSFINLVNSSTPFTGITVTLSGNVYYGVAGSGIYMQNNKGLGAVDLDGGELILKAGTGKGTGKSRYKIVTGQKTASGTDMQIETVRAEFDEDGNYTRIGTPVYADNASALAGGLIDGMEYRTATGIKMEVY